MNYIIGIDQSTQATKAVLFDETGKFVDRADRKHEQIIDDKGWVSHDLMEIYRNTVLSVKDVIKKAGIDKRDIKALGISNQRETTAIWDKTGNPLERAVVWQCNRAEQVAKRYRKSSEMIYEKTGLPLSPYFPAAKMTWLIEHTVHAGKYCLGTMDSWLIYKLTGGDRFCTDYSNASRTQLFNLHSLCWDQDLCEIFGIKMETLPQVCDSNACFGYTDFDGYLERKIPIHGVMGDSHAALFGQRCHCPGMVKATYGTGSSIMMNVGDSFIKSRAGLATSLAWSINGRVDYVLEGNINYAGAVISWLQKDMHLIQGAQEAEEYAARANPQDTAILVPAFTGLGAPYWIENAKAMLYGMSRTTGQAEIVKAAVESIAFQVMDVLYAMKNDSGRQIKEICVDGGPTKNRYLMQFQCDMADTKICVSKQEELSAIGSAYMAGMAAGIYKQEDIFANISYDFYEPQMEKARQKERQSLWKEAVDIVRKSS